MMKDLTWEVVNQQSTPKQWGFIHGIILDLADDKEKRSLFVRLFTSEEATQMIARWKEADAASVILDEDEALEIISK